MKHDDAALLFLQDIFPMEQRTGSTFNQPIQSTRVPSM
jgi:hypothetical protein